MTTQPRVQAVLPVRNASASSMQSPPASAEVTRVEILSPGLARPGASPRSRCRSTSWGRPRCKARVAGRSRPALATRRWSSKVIWIRSGWLRGNIYWVLLVLGSVCCYKTIIPEAQEHFLVSSGPRYTPSSGGLGFIQASGFLTAALVHSFPMAMLFAAIFGAGFRGRNPPTTAIRGDYFGKKAFATIGGISSAPMYAFMLAAAFLFDATGSYAFAFLATEVWA